MYNEPGKTLVPQTLVKLPKVAGWTQSNKQISKVGHVAMRTLEMWKVVGACDLLSPGGCYNVGGGKGVGRCVVMEFLSPLVLRCAARPIR